MNDEIKLVEYNHDMAEVLVRMWKESKEGWPPGFLGSSTKSPDNIRRHHEPGSFIHTTIAMLEDRAVGYIRTTGYGGETDAAYVALLNAVKDMHGKGIGKRLILDSLKRVTEKGFYRLDLHTWPANMKAVPLYKKTGFVWIPETSVYMQNYIPFILQRPEMQEFLENEDWYRCQVRDLDVEPDDNKVEGERRVFRYAFEREGARLEAEFDLAGRILSAWKSPGSDVRISRKINKVFFGRPFQVYVNGKDLPNSIPATGSDHLRTPDFVKISDEKGIFDVEPLPVDVPFDERERAPRIMLQVPGKNPLEIGLGVQADDAVALKNFSHRMQYGEDFLKLELMRREEIEKATVYYSIGSGKWDSIEADVGRAVYSAVKVPVPELEPGLHNMKIRIDTKGIRGSERSFHITRAPLTGTTGWIGKKHGILENNRLCMMVSRRGAAASISFSGREDAFGQAGYIRLCAGPPLSQSDLPRQRFDLRLNNEEIISECDWPSKPGLRFITRFSLNGESVICAQASVINNSDFSHEIEFVAYGAGTNGFADNVVFSVDKGILHSKQIMRFFPEDDEDLPSRISEMPFPWRGVTGRFGTVLANLSDWDGFYYGNPKTDIKIVEPGKVIHSPLIMQVAETGRFINAFRYAKAIGWNTGPEPDEENLVDFPIIDLPPISEPGCRVSLTNPVRGIRNASIMVDGETVAEGKPELNEFLETGIQSGGLHNVRFNVGGREQERRIYITGKSGEVKTSEESGYLKLINEFLELSINPKARGHINSLRIDGHEWLLSSDPEPGTFAFQKPWFGGLLPGYSHRGNFMDPCKLEEIEPDYSLVEEEIWNIRYPVWKLSWHIDEEEKGSVNLVWKVGLLPSLPLLKTTVEIKQLAESRPQGLFMCRGFFAPGGNTEGSVLHYFHRMPTFQGRDHEGNWTILRSPFRISSPTGQYVELHSSKENLAMAEDYAALGCHISTFSLRFPPRPLECFWLFSNGEEHEDISEVLKEHFEQKIIE